MQSETVQASNLQFVERRREVVRKPLVRHVMPGLISEIARAFRSPRKCYTTRAVQEDMKVKSDVVSSALFQDLYNKVERLERLINAGDKSPSGATALYIVRRAA